VKSYITELYDWEESINKKKSKRKLVKQPYVAQIRGNVHESEKKEKEN